MNIFKKICMVMIIVVMKVVCSNVVLADIGAEEVLKVGDYVKFGKYLNEPIIWRVIYIVKDDDIYDESSNSNIYKNKGVEVGDLLLLSDRIITFKCFDAKDSNEKIVDRKDKGNNEWSKSNLRDWLNSEDDNVIWTTQEPNSVNVEKYDKIPINPYASEKGFLCNDNFIKQERNMIKLVTHKHMINSDCDIKDGGNVKHEYSYNQPDGAIKNYDNASYKNSTDKVFVLSIKELAKYVDGKLKYSNDKDYHIAYTTSKSRKQSNYRPGFILNDDKDRWYYWTRDAYTDYSNLVRSVNTIKIVYRGNAYNGTNGVRQALYLNIKGATLIDGDGQNPNKAYKVIPDMEKPTGIFELIGIPVTNKNITVNFNPDDVGSGVEKWVYSISTDGGKTYSNEVIVNGDISKDILLTEEGDNKIKVIVYDCVGNSTEFYSDIYIIDRVSPDKPVITYNPESITNKDVKVNIQYSNDSFSKEYRINNFDYKEYNGEFSISNNGIVYARSCDNAGNYSDEVECKILNIDKKAPNDPIIDKESGTYDSKIIVRIVNIDEDMGKVYYTLDSSLPNNKKNLYNNYIEVDGKHNELVVLKLIAYDKADNKSNIVEIEFKFDKGLLYLTDNDKKNFKYYIGKDQRGLLRVMLVSKTGKDLEFDKFDILDLDGVNKNYFKKGIYYIDIKGNFRKYK